MKKTIPLSKSSINYVALPTVSNKGKQFRIQIAGERISIPPTIIISIEHERGAREEEVEFQLKWRIQ